MNNYDLFPTDINNLINMYADEIKLTQMYRKNYLICEMNEHILDWNWWTDNNRENEAMIILTKPINWHTYRHGSMMSTKTNSVYIDEFL